MASRPLAAATAVALCVLAAGCSNGDDAPAEPKAGVVAIEEVGLELDVPAELADLTHAMGESEEGQPAVYFSTSSLESAGGTTCAAGAEAAVSPYPLGQVVVSEETPGHVRREARENPEEDLGTFVVRAGDSYLYYVAPPTEPCVTDNPSAAELQRRQTTLLRSALPTLRLSD